MNKELIMEAIKATKRLEKERAILIKGIKELDLTNADLNNPKVNKMLEIVRKYENL
nr:MAG TPA: hypothetical protein [Caudoviricetes sp.]